MAFSFAFELLSPLGTSPANAIDTYILDDVKKALAERYTLEHVALDSAEAGATDPTSANAQGRHIPGKVSCLFYGTYAQLTALTSPGVGAMGYASDTGNFYRYFSGTGWTILAVSSETVVPDDTTLEIVGTSGSGAGILGMKHDYQQWTDMVTLTDGASIATNCNLGNSFSVTLGGNRILANPTNPHAGASYVWRVVQDATGSRTLAFGSNFAFPGGVAPTLTTTGGAVDIIVAIYDGTKFNCSVMYDMK